MRARRSSAVVAFALAWLAVQCLGMPGAWAAEAVDVALVLAADVSRSITTDEFQLQRQGYATGITSPAVIKAIRAGSHGAIALTFIEWSGASEQQIVVDWQIIRDVASADSFVDKMQAAPRSFYGRTSISGAIDYSRILLTASPFLGIRRVIDISGDGANNRGRAVTLARDEAIRDGISINGLPILALEPDLDRYYYDNVIGGPGAFMVPATNYDTFADAILKKLITEIAGVAPNTLTEVRF